MTDASDPELVQRALAGDAAAYAALLRRHFDAVFAIARRLTATDEDAEDACQDAFTRAFFRLDRCGDASRFAGWIAQIARHHAHNVRRYHALRSAASLDDAPPVASSAATDRDAETAELRDALRRALSSLTPVRRAVVVHHDVDGWTHAQIADALRISVLMSRRHLSDARAMLRRELGDVARDHLFDGGFDDD